MPHSEHGSPSLPCNFLFVEVVMAHGLETMKRINDDETRKHYEQTPGAEPLKRLTIAIDYDDTFTSDPATWAAVCHMLTYWHEVICVSSRRNCVEHREELRKHLPACVKSIVLSFDAPKREAARKAGFHVDIWIDDRPEAIATKEECLALVG